MRLKLPANSFHVVRERERGNVCVNSKCTSFASVCDMKLSKMLDDYETLVLALSPRRVCLFVLTLVHLFCHDIFPPRFNLANDIVFLIFKLNSHCLSFRSRRRSRSNFLREGYRNLNCCYFV